MRKTIKEQILEHLNSGYTLTYGQANLITNSQSGYRRLQEILADNPKRYRFVKAKSENGGYYNVFGLPRSFFHVAIMHRSVLLFGKGAWKGKRLAKCLTVKEAKAQIKRVVR